MGWLVAALAVIVVIGFAAPRRPRNVATPPASPDDVDDLVARGDQVELLRRYGTDEDVARLIAEGRGDDLAGLGYRADR